MYELAWVMVTILFANADDGTMYHGVPHYGSLLRDFWVSGQALTNEIYSMNAEDISYSTYD